MKFPTITRSVSILLIRQRRTSHFAECRPFFDAILRPFSTAMLESQELKEFTEYMDNLKNYEKTGVPRGSGTNSDDGFDLGRMSRLLQCLGNPQTKLKVLHISGTKGKGSTAAFLSSILRSEGYHVGCYTSPHIRTIRERITLGADGEPVSAKALNSHFHQIKKVLDTAIRHERGHLSHFEVFTALAFSLFAEEKVQLVVMEAGLGGARDATNVLTSAELAVSIITNIGGEHLAALGGTLESVAVAKSGIIKERRPLILGGPFLPHIERIICDKASSMNAPVVSASDPGNKSAIKGFCRAHEMSCQLCDILLLIERDFHTFIELHDVRLRMLGSHQLQNAATATCGALCLRNQGWNLSDTSIRAGLESTYLVGRSQLLTSKETKMLGLPGANILLDGAHTKESAEALMNMIKMAFPDSRLILVVAMANDKDHLGFARVLLSGGCLEAVCFTEVDIAGDRSRVTSSTSLKDIWIKACGEMGIGFIDRQSSKHESGRFAWRNGSVLLMEENSLTGSLRFGNEFLAGNDDGMIVVTGSLHVVSALLHLLD